MPQGARRSSLFRPALAALLPALLAASPLASPADARARQQIDDDSGRFEAYATQYEEPPPLDLSELRALAALLEPSDDQRAQIDDMAQSYLDKLRTNRRTMSRWYEATFVPNGTWRNEPELWEKARPVTERYNKHVQKLRENLLGDVKLLLSPEQLGRWPMLEARLKRRDLVRSGGQQIGLAAVDLEALVRSAVGVGKPLPEETAAALQGYQDALDRAAAIAEQWTIEASRYQDPPPDEGDAEDPERWRRTSGLWYARALERWKPVRDANLAAFRRVLPTLTEEARDRLRVAFYTRASDRRFSLGFGNDLDFDRIENLRGLTDEQRSRIAEARRSYEKSVADKLEREVLAELKAQDDDPVAFGGTRHDSTDWMARWQEKIESERPVRAVLEEILTEDQHEAAGLGKKARKMDVPTFEKE